MKTAVVIVLFAGVSLVVNGLALGGPAAGVKYEVRTAGLVVQLDENGIYDEFADRGPALNCAALLGVRKPVIAWTPSVKTLQPDADAYFQRHLHLGVYPTVPYPENDHAILPDAWAERQYLDYGPLLEALRGKKWVLTPHCVEVQEGAAKSNLFEVPGGYVVPVTFGGTKRVVRLTLRGLRRPEGLRSFHAEALHPGGGKVPLPIAWQDQDRMEVDVPLLRGCAIVRLSYAWIKPEQDPSPVTQ